MTCDTWHVAGDTWHMCEECLNADFNIRLKGLETVTAESGGTAAHYVGLFIHELYNALGVIHTKEATG